MLTGAALEKWNDAVHNCTRKPKTGENEIELDPLGQTEETFKKAKMKWKTTYFQTDPLYNMHENLRSGIKFPVGKGILVKDWVKWLTVINSKLSRFPKLKHWHAGAKLNLDNEEIKQIITRVCPISWQTKLQLSGKSTYQHSIELLTTFLDAVQRDMADAAKLKKNSHKEKKPNRSANKINKNVNGWGVKSPKCYARTASAMAPRSGSIRTTTLTTLRTRKGKRSKTAKGLK